MLLVKRQAPLLIFIFLFVSCQTIAQVTFQKTYGGSNKDWGYSIQQTDDEGYIISGGTKSFGSGGSDIYLIKIDKYGDTLWTKTYGGSGDDWAGTVKQTFDRGYIITGSTTSFGSGSEDMYAIATDSAGNLLWSKTYGGTGSDRGAAVQQNNDSGYVFLGSTTSFGNGGDDIYLVRTNSNGDTLWTRTFGGPYQDWGATVHQVTDGGFFIVGQYTFANTFPTPTFYIYLIRTNGNGDLLWSNNIYSSGRDRGYSGHQTADGGYIIAGQSQIFSESACLIKTDSLGNIVWTKNFVGASGGAYARSVQQTSDGGYILSGKQFILNSVHAYIVKTDMNGDSLWTGTYGSSSHLISVQQTMDGGYIGNGEFNYPAGDSEIFLIKTDGSGGNACNFNWLTILASVVYQSSIPSHPVSSGGTVGAPPTVVGSGGNVTTLCFSAGLNENEVDDSLNIFPNPSAGGFNISFNEIINNGVLDIFDVNGKNIFNRNLYRESNAAVNLEFAPAGLYFVRVSDGTHFYYGKITVEHY